MISIRPNLSLQKTLCWNYGNSFLYFFDTNFVKVTVLLKKVIRFVFTKFFQWEIISRFSSLRLNKIFREINSFVIYIVKSCFHETIVKLVRKEISETSKLCKSNNLRNVEKEFLPPTVNIEEIIRSPFVRGGFFWWQHSRSSCYPYSIFFMISPVSIIAKKKRWNFIENLCGWKIFYTAKLFQKYLQFSGCC